jgi:hypothetical protein
MTLVQPDPALLIWLFVIAGFFLCLGALIGIIIYRSFRKKKY